MANILITYFSDYGEVMYDAITKILQQNGNNIFRFNINCSKVHISKWGGDSIIVDKSLLQQIKDFSVNIVFNFNNSLPQNCLEIFDKGCKICIIDADNPETFWNQNTLLENQDRYYYLGLQSYSKKMYESFLNENLIIGRNYLYFPPATIVTKEILPLDKNITFIGSNFYPYSIPFGYHFYNENAIKLYKSFKKNYFLSIDEAKATCPEVENIEWLYEKVRAFNAGQERIKFLQTLTDLGLIFYGSRNWEQINYIDLELGACHDQTEILSLEENQWVYNTSKISINISHPQAVSSFSWRVMDIMASNACLLMEDKPDWRDLFQKYLSEETIDTVIYKDRFDMREKAIKLLDNEELRLRCVADLNNAIEQNGRWENRFKELEKLTGIKLLNLDNKNAQIIFVQKDDFDNKQKQNIIKHLLAKLKLKNRFKIFIYSLSLALAQIPILDLVQRKKIRNKLRQKIDKYWR